MNASDQYPPLAKLREALRLLRQDSNPQFRSVAKRLVAEAVCELEQPQETEEQWHTDHFCPALDRTAPGLSSECPYDHSRPAAMPCDPELARVAASRRRRLPTVCTCPSVGGFSHRCEVHGHRVDRTPIG